MVFRKAVLLASIFIGGCADFIRDPVYEANLFRKAKTVYKTFQDPATGKEYRVGYSVGVKRNGRRAREITLRPMDKGVTTLIRAEDNNFDGDFEFVETEPEGGESEYREIIQRAADYMEGL